MQNKKPEKLPFFIKSLDGLTTFQAFLDLGSKQIQVEVFLHSIMVTFPYKTHLKILKFFTKI